MVFGEAKLTIGASPDCFRDVPKHREYWNKWIVDECWIDVIKEQYDMPESI
jgi:hypothetical protein